ncbi:MAG: hypothetical protein LBW85_14165 [Deltaproteobacteria bacterium]|nr:hypothetical protein [Deltaproteobacteria bacterium]
MEKGRRRPGPTAPEDYLEAPDDRDEGGGASPWGSDDADQAPLEPILDPALDASLDDGPDADPYGSADGAAAAPDSVIMPHLDGGGPPEEPYLGEPASGLAEEGPAASRDSRPDARRGGPAPSSGSSRPDPAGESDAFLGLDEPGFPDFEDGGGSGPLELFSETGEEEDSEDGVSVFGDEYGDEHVPASPGAEASGGASLRAAGPSLPEAPSGAAAPGSPPGRFSDEFSPDDILKDMDEVLGSFEGYQAPAVPRPAAAEAASSRLRPGAGQNRSSALQEASLASGRDPAAYASPAVPEPPLAPASGGLSGQGRRTGLGYSPGQEPASGQGPEPELPPEPGKAAAAPAPRRPAPPAPARSGGLPPTVAYRPPTPAKPSSSQASESRTILLTDRVDARSAGLAAPPEPPAAAPLAGGASIRSGGGSGTLTPGRRVRSLEGRGPAAPSPPPASPMGHMEPPDSGEPLELTDPAQPGGAPPHGAPPSGGAAAAPESPAAAAFGDGTVGELSARELFSLIETAVERGIAKALAKDRDRRGPS